MSTGTAVTPLQQVCQGLQKMENNFKQALPAGLKPDRFIRTATNAIQMHPQRDKLLSANRQSLYNACQKAAIDGLLLDGSQAALIVFGNDVSYIPMVQGLVKLARNSGEIASIVAEVVYEKDKFVYRIGLDEMPMHEPDWFGERGEPVGVWACVKLKNGETISRLLPKDKIMRIANKTKNAFQYDPQKGPHYDEWWRKTAIKNVLKYAPKSSELEMALARGEDEFSDETIEIAPPQSQPVAKPERQTRAAQVIKEAPPPQEQAPEYDDDGVIDVESEVVEQTYEDDEGLPI